MASYDVKNGGAYVLEAGRYDISLRSDSHTVIDTKPITVDQTITYNTADSTHDGDLIPATNQFRSTDVAVTKNPSESFDLAMGPLTKRLKWCGSIVPSTSTSLKSPIIPDAWARSSVATSDGS